MFFGILIFFKYYLFMYINVYYFYLKKNYMFILLFLGGWIYYIYYLLNFNKFKYNFYKIMGRIIFLNKVWILKE